MQAVGRDEKASVDRQARALRGFDLRGHAVVVLGIADDPVAQADRAGPEAFERRAVEQHLQLPPVHRVLRPAVAREQAARLGVDVVAVAPHQRPLARLDADGVEHLLADAELVELAHRVGLQVDAHPQRLQGGHGLQDHTGHADLVQREGEGHAPDAAAGDQDGAGIDRMRHAAIFAGKRISASPMRMRLPLSMPSASAKPFGANTMMVEPCSNQPISSPLR